MHEHTKELPEKAYRRLTKLNLFMDTNLDRRNDDANDQCVSNLLAYS